MLNINFVKMISYVVLLFVIISGILFYFYNKNTQKESVQYSENTNFNKNPDTSLNTTLDTSIKTFKIVAFGDSLTAGYGVELKDSYPSILQDVLNKNSEKFINKNENEKDKSNINFELINMGVSGETTAGGLDRFLFILEQKPDLVLLGLGANDMLRGVDTNVTKNNLEAILKKFKDNNQKVILLGMQSVSSYGVKYKNDFDAIYPELSKKYNIPLVPFFLEGVAKVEKYNTSDGIHPNRSGYEKIVSENMMPILINYLSKNI